MSGDANSVWTTPGRRTTATYPTRHHRALAALTTTDKVNKARVIVDKGVSFLFGGDITFQCDEDAPAGAQDWLDACWKANRQGSLLHDLALNGGVCGHTFLKIDLPDPSQGEEFPSSACRTRRRTPSSGTPAISRRSSRSPYSGTPSIRPPRRSSTSASEIVKQGAGWHITDEESAPDSGNWKPTNDVDWPHPWPPVAECKNLPAPNEWWGISDIQEDVLSLNRQASSLLTNLLKIIDFHGHPKTIITGTVGADVAVDPNKAIILPDPAAKAYNLEMLSDLSSSINTYDKVCEAIHEVARVPAVSTGTLDKLGPLSGVALKVLYQPLIEKTDSKRTLYGEMLQELCSHLLELGGYPGCSVTVTWPEMLPVDPLPGAADAPAHGPTGIVSKQTMAARIHLDWETEKEHIEEEAKEDAAATPAVPGMPGQPGANPAQALPPPPMTNAPMDRGMKPQGA